MWVLEAVGGSYQRRHDPLRGYVFLDDSVRNLVEHLSRSSEQIISWLEDDESQATVIRSLQPAIKFDEIIAKSLPMIFETAFGKICGTWRAGAGTRFIIAVLREAGIRSRKEADERIFEAIKKARYRV
jgi:hypothetical protein